MTVLHFPELTLINGHVYNDIYCELPYELFTESLLAEEETFVEFYYIGESANEEIPLAIRSSCIASYELAFLFDSKEEADNFNPAELCASEIVKPNDSKEKKDTDGDIEKNDVFFDDISEYADILSKIIAESPTLKSIYGSSALH